MAAQPDYSNIDRPYDGLMDRSVSGVPLSQLPLTGPQANALKAQGAGALDNQQTFNQDGGQWLQNWVKSRNFSQGVKGFMLDGQTGEARFGPVHFTRNGMALKNGFGIFAKPPDSQNPLFLVDNFRFFTDQGTGYGVIALPMSDKLFINGTGSLPPDNIGTRTGESIVQFNGESITGATGNMLTPVRYGGGMSSFSGAIWLPLNESDIETLPAYKFRGMIYYNSTAQKVRIFKGSHAAGSWQDLTHNRGVVASHLASATGSATYGHSLGDVPTSVDIFATNFATQSNFSNGYWDGIDNTCTYGGGNQGANSSNIVRIDQGGNITIGTLTGVDASNITINWTKSGSPTGTIYLHIRTHK